MDSSIINTDQSQSRQSINLIQLLNQKQNINSKDENDNLDSSLENNHSQDSDDEYINDESNNNDQNEETIDKQNTGIEKSQKSNSDQQGENRILPSSLSNTTKDLKNMKKCKKGDAEKNCRSNQRFNILEPEQSSNSRQKEQGDEEQKNNSNQPSSNEPMNLSSRDSLEENEGVNQYQMFEEEENVQSRQANQASNNHNNSLFNQQDINYQNNLNNNQISLNNGEENNLRNINNPRNQLDPLQSLFHNIVPLREQNFNTVPINREQMQQFGYFNDLQNRNYRLQQNLRRQLRYSRRYRNSLQNSVCPEGYQILTTESLLNQIKYLYCAAVSLALIFCFLLFSMKNSNKFVIFFILSLLMFGLFYIFYKIKSLNSIRLSQIHENNYFSYRFSNEESPQNNRYQIGDVLQERISNLQPSNSIGRSFQRNNRQIRRYLSNMILYNSIFSILNQMQIQSGSQDCGYNDEQLNQIGGQHKYSDLKILLKIQKDIKAESDETNNQNNNNKESQKKEDELEDENDDNQCIVCLEKLQNDNDVRLLKCQHYFHQICLDEWLKKKRECPVCRQCPLQVELTASQQAQQNSSPYNFDIPIISMTGPLRNNSIQRSQILQNVNQMNGNQENGNRQNMNIVLLYQ